MVKLVLQVQPPRVPHQDPSPPAVRLLNETSPTATEIASKTGFVDASSFAEQFKHRTGMTPTEYRAKQAK